MKRLAGLCLAITLLPFALADAQQPSASRSDSSAEVSKKDRDKAAAQFYSAQASLFSALAHAQALEKITASTGEPDFNLARVLISTANREIQGTLTSSVSMGQAIHSLEQTEAMKTMRSKLNEALSGLDEAHAAADGHGAVSPHAKESVAHLLNAMTALVVLAEEAGLEALNAPGVDAIEDAKNGGLRPGAGPPRRRNTQ